MIPNNDSVSWYHPDQDVENGKPSSSSVKSFKNEYNKVFDEINGGFVDAYSLSKGGALLKTNRIDHFHSNDDLSPFHSQTENNFQNPSFTMREHDLRSVWIPKKYAGRNMFVSHIDSTLFPEKAGFV